MSRLALTLSLLLAAPLVAEETRFEGQVRVSPRTIVLLTPGGERALTGSDDLRDALRALALRRVSVSVDPPLKGQYTVRRIESVDGRIPEPYSARILSPLFRTTRLRLDLRHAGERMSLPGEPQLAGRHRDLLEVALGRTVQVVGFSLPEGFVLTELPAPDAITGRLKRGVDPTTRWIVQDDGTSVRLIATPRALPQEMSRVRVRGQLAGGAMLVVEAERLAEPVLPPPPRQGRDKLHRADTTGVIGTLGELPVDGTYLVFAPDAPESGLRGGEQATIWGRWLLRDVKERPRFAVTRFELRR